MDAASQLAQPEPMTANRVTAATAAGRYTTLSFAVYPLPGENDPEEDIGGTSTRDSNAFSTSSTDSSLDTIRADPDKNQFQPYSLGNELQKRLPHLEDITKCANCSKTPGKYLVCPCCLRTRYCGKYCQIWDWQLHKLICVRSEHATDGKVEAFEKWISGYWEGAVEELRKHVVGVEDARAVQVLRGQTRGRGDVVALALGDVSSRRAERGEMGARAESLSVMLPSSDVRPGRTGEGTGPRDSIPRAAGDTFAETDHEEDSQGRRLSTKTPKSPPSMYWSRAISLHLAQGGSFEADRFAVRK